MRIDESTDFQTRSLLCVPLRAGEEVIGALEAVNKRKGEDFDGHDEALAEAIASQAGEAIQRARLIEQNIRSQRLAAIGETVAGLAHCIKNVLNGLQGGAYLVNSGMKRGKQDTLLKGWRTVERNIGRISALALDMLDYAKERTPVLEPADINDLAREVVALMEGKAKASGVAVSAETSAAVPEFCFDAKSIHRCILNLVSNAIDACEEEGGEVRVGTGVAGAEWIEVKVSDNGCGMGPDVQRKLFTSFFSTKGSRGTGLGLPVTRKILREHGGDLLLESEPGVGTTFTCRLPLRLAPA
jgi:signal transduction histidine kinase